MPTSPHKASVRVILALSSTVACSVATGVTPAELPTELSFTSVVAQAPMRDTARVAGVQGSVAVLGLLNQTAPCFSLSSAASREGGRILLRLTAKEAAGTCATFVAGAFDYDVGVRGIAPGTYDVDVLHRVLFKDGRVTEAKVGGRVVDVR